MAKKYSSSKNAYDCNDSVKEAATNKALSKNWAKISSKNSYSSESSKNDYDDKASTDSYNDEASDDASDCKNCR